MQERQASPISLHQCLFGYDNGHRLLASSIKLSSESHSVLLPLSDLVPGLNISEVGSYWTGFPLRDLKHYALMRTWPAPEMSRPGCVWTHVIMVSFADIARFTDLGLLRYLSNRPILSQGYDSFSNSISIDLAELSPLNCVDENLVNPIQVLPLIRAVYAKYNADIETKPGELDEAIFGFWSQQWPRLRRSFSFRTASSRLETSYPGVRFDIRLIVGSEKKKIVEADLLANMKTWEAEAVQDICNGNSKKLRQFLWRYGSDLNNGRERYHLLAELYYETRVELLQGKKLEAIIELITRNIPDPLDSLTLKKDLVSCGNNQYSLLPTTDAIDTLAFFFSHPDLEALPLPPLQICDHILDSWKTRQEDILKLSLNAAMQYTKLSDVVLHKLASIVESSFLLSYSKLYPEFRRRLIELNPSLLLSEELFNIPQAEMNVLIALALDIQPDLIDKLLRYLLRINDEFSAKEMMRRFPINVVKASAERLLSTVEDNDVKLPFAWRRELARNAEIFLNAGIVENANSTRYLFLIAELLGFDSCGVLKVGPRPWVLALKFSQDNVAGNDRQTFLAFLLVLAIHNPVSGTELLFERAFKAVHIDISKSRLSTVGQSLLLKYLPEIAWYNSWDTCKRLRIAVISAYIRGNLDPMSFHKLTIGDKALMEHANKSKKGQMLLNKVSVELIDVAARV